MIRDARLWLYPDCVMVDGIAKSAIYDLGRRRLHILSVEMARAVQEVLGATQEQLDLLSHRYDWARLAVEYLVDNDLVRWADHLNWRSSYPREPVGPHKVRHAIIDILHKRHDFGLALSELTSVNCQFLQLRVFNTGVLQIADYRQILEDIIGGTITGVELLLPFAETETLGPCFWDLACGSVALRRVVVFGAGTKEVPEKVSALLLSRGKLVMADCVWEGAKDCGFVTKSSLMPPDPRQFFRLQSFNGCLAGKVSIDADGFIRQCPSMPVSFGRLGDIPLGQIVASSDFESVAHITSEKVAVCRTCEYRYACTGCLAFTLPREGGLWGKPERCCYDPGRGIWLDSPTLRKGIAVSNRAERAGNCHA